MYVERPARLGGTTLWANAGDRAVRVLPDGCMDLMVSDGRLVVAGPDTVAKVSPAGSAWVGLRFAPGLAPSLLGVPAVEIADARPDLADVLPRTRTRAPRNPEPTTKFLEGLALRLAAEAEPEPWTGRLVRLLTAGSPVAAAARELCWSERQLRRRSMVSFGYGPATLAAILRFRRAVGLADEGRPLAEVASRAGYADQAHLARSARTFAGVPMTTLLRERAQAGSAA